MVTPSRRCLLERFPSTQEEPVRTLPPPRVVHGDVGGRTLVELDPEADSAAGVHPAEALRGRLGSREQVHEPGRPPESVPGERYPILALEVELVLAPDAALGVSPAAPGVGIPPDRRQRKIGRLAEGEPVARPDREDAPGTDPVVAPELGLEALPVAVAPEPGIVDAEAGVDVIAGRRVDRAAPIVVREVEGEAGGDVVGLDLAAVVVQQWGRETLLGVGIHNLVVAVEVVTDANKDPSGGGPIHGLVDPDELVFQLILL